MEIFFPMFSSSHWGELVSIFLQNFSIIFLFRETILTWDFPFGRLKIGNQLWELWRIYFISGLFQLLSPAVWKHCPETTWGGKSLFSSQVTVHYWRKLGQNLKQKQRQDSWRKAACWLNLHGSLSVLSYKTRVMYPEVAPATVGGTLSQPSLLKKHLQAHLMEERSQLRFLLPRWLQFAARWQNRTSTGKLWWLVRFFSCFFLHRNLSFSSRSFSWLE